MPVVTQRQITAAHRSSSACFMQRFATRHQRRLKGTVLRMRKRRSSVTILDMKRQFIALIVMLAIGLQGPVVAFAGISPLMSTDCQVAAVSHSDASQDSCCPKGQRSVSCCLEACAGTVAGAVTVIPQVLNWLGSTTPPPQFRSTHFSSRGDSPLIRPPIL